MENLTLTRMEIACGATHESLSKIGTYDTAIAIEGEGLLRGWMYIQKLVAKESALFVGAVPDSAHKLLEKTRLYGSGKWVKIHRDHLRNSDIIGRWLIVVTPNEGVIMPMHTSPNSWSRYWEEWWGKFEGEIVIWYGL
jgi:hypothetical protein